MNRVVRAEFETSAADASGWPEGGLAELAFVGRSNVGKSSLLNAMAERKGLARVSGDPGRTRLLNFFRVDLIDDEAGGRRTELRLVDLPGFGYAKVSREERATWRPAIQRYLGGRPCLRAVALLVDARRIPMGKGDGEAPTEEIDLCRWIGERRVRVVPTVTKSDKLSKHERPLLLDRARKLFGAPPVLVSALTLDGRDRLWARLLAALADGSGAPDAGGLTPPIDTD